ncbi:drug/metabolite transporter (DMT)-like permease [Kutzneria viridogrisea]|uniref:Drug/metabolite transporter (DMT)-like permease n=1 Tax=Kutzneria viridogrisea TaxID=47990 RepID=A0ABR6BHZ6_9PSEU|nr:drug/metabolite transporter (DMT)-like permease [Kutzneria viridogrisea]
MTRRGWVLFGLMAVIWGLPYLMIKVAVAEVPAPVLVFARTAIGAAVLLPLCLRSAPISLLRGHWRPLLAFAATEVLGPWLLLADAEKRLPSSTTGLLIAAVPIIGALLAPLTGDRERIGRRRWTGLLIGFGGVALLAGPHLSGGDAWAIAEVLLCALGYAIAPIIVARRLTEFPGIPLTALSLALSAVVYSPVAFLTWPASPPGGQALAAVLGLALICTATAFVLFFALIREAGPSRAMVFTYFNPVVAVAAGALVLAEPVTGSTAAAFALVLCGSLLATGRAADRAVTAEPSARP